ncbi:MAG: sugar-binding transcriptional regulator [Chloroflexi bacterium]|nr:sugar-binding transcriptional regulator [Chloroflexota bacterium]
MKLISQRFITFGLFKIKIMYTNSQDLRLILKCCTKFYLDGMSQAEISKQLGISRSTVCRLIKTGKDRGYVQISISSPLKQEDYTNIERQIEKHFGIKEAVVCGDTFADDWEQKKELGKTAVEYLKRILRKGDIVGLSLGSTLYAMSQVISTPNDSQCIFVPMLGGIGQNRYDIHPNHLARDFSLGFGGKAIYLHAPAYVEHPDIKKNLLMEPSVQQVFDYYKRINVSLVGIGVATKDSALMETKYYDQACIDQLYSDDMVGDMCLHFYDIKGNFERYAINQNVFGMELSWLKKVPYSIGFASGLHKTKSVVGALRTGLINVLVTHYSLAKSVLDYCERGT